MSMTPEDAAYEEYMAQLYEEHKQEAIEEFTDERLKSYYNENRLLAEPAFNALIEARKLIGINATAGLIYAAIAMEVGLKETLLKPIVFGLVHATPVATLITDLAISYSSMDKYRELLLQILQQHGGVNLDTYLRLGSSKPVWQEIKEVQKQRNLVLHRAEIASDEKAHLALGVASTIIENLFPAVVTKMGMHLHDGFRICSGWKCNYKGRPKWEDEW